MSFNTYQVIFDVETLAKDRSKAIQQALREAGESGARIAVSCIRDDSLSSSGKDEISRTTQRMVVLDVRAREQLEYILSRMEHEADAGARKRLLNDAMQLLS